MATPEGLEPSTCRLEVGCSIQLSYGATPLTYSGHNRYDLRAVLWPNPQHFKLSSTYDAHSLKFPFPAQIVPTKARFVNHSYKKAAKTAC